MSLLRNKKIIDEEQRIDDRKDKSLFGQHSLFNLFWFEEIIM
jgi:hypothetical protein